MKLKQRETGRQGVMRACLDLLAAEKIRHWRMNAGDRFGSHKGKPWRIRGHAKGTPDILAAVPMWMDINAGEYVKRFTAFVWIETKPTDGKPTPEQLQFADEARNNDEYWLLIDDAKKLDDWLMDNRAL